MKTVWFLLAIITPTLLTGCCPKTTKSSKTMNEGTKAGHSLLGEWVRIGPAGPVRFEFKESGVVDGDFGNDQTIDVISMYEIENDTITFTDKEGQICQGSGVYKIDANSYYIAFDLIDDNCGGRIKTTMGFWTRPNFSDILEELNREIAKTSKPGLFLNRARVYMAIGKPKQARADLDFYLTSDSTCARVYINRAGTRFPYDLDGVVRDCNKAITLEPDNKNAYFLRGLALYDLGEKEQACNDFSKAIELGFSILSIAEQEKCSMYWNRENPAAK